MDPTPPSEPPSAWHFFDRIFCITLADRPDRRALAETEFARVGLAGLVEFVVVQRHPSDSEQGIYESHMRCLRAGLAAGVETFVVFEDDVIFPDFSPDRLSDAVEFLQSKTPWDAFFFGCFVNASRKTSHRSVIKIRYKTTAHAYVLSRAYAATLLEKTWQGVPYDDLIRSMASDRLYASYPALAFQGNASTDNRKMLAIDRIRRMLGGIRRLQKLNEWTNRHFLTLVIVHGLIVVFVIVLLVFWRMQLR